MLSLRSWLTPVHYVYVFFSLLQGACVKKLSGKGKLEDSRATKQIVALLSAPLEKYNDIVTALNLSNYPKVMDHLDTATNKVMAVVIIQSIMKNNTCISTADNVGTCLLSLLTLLRIKSRLSTLSSIFICFKSFLQFMTLFRFRWRLYLN